MTNERWGTTENLDAEVPVCERCGVRYRVGAQPGGDWQWWHSCILDARLTAGQMLRLLTLRDAGQPLDPFYIYGDTGATQDSSSPSY